MVHIRCDSPVNAEDGFHDSAIEGIYFTNR